MDRSSAADRCAIRSNTARRRSQCNRRTCRRSRQAGRTTSRRIARNKCNCARRSIRPSVRARTAMRSRSPARNCPHNREHPRSRSLLYTRRLARCTHKLAARIQRRNSTSGPRTGVRSHSSHRRTHTPARMRRLTRIRSWRHIPNRRCRRRRHSQVRILDINPTPGWGPEPAGQLCTRLLSGILCTSVESSSLSAGRGESGMPPVKRCSPFSCPIARGAAVERGRTTMVIIGCRAPAQQEKSLQSAKSRQSARLISGQNGAVGLNPSIHRDSPRLRLLAVAVRAAA